MLRGGCLGNEETFYKECIPRTILFTNCICTTTTTKDFHSAGVLGSTIIEWIKTGDTTSIAGWIQSGGDPDWTIDYSPLISYAGNRQQIAVANLLIKSGADINKTDWNGRIALHNAVGRNDTSMIAFLLNKGADIEARDSSDWTPLY
jgi:hypothetical protein